MKPDELESKLRGLPVRNLPPEWRAEILGACEVHASLPATLRAEHRHCEPAWWIAWLLPGRAGWAALGAAWFLILVLHLATSSDGQRAGRAPLASAEPWLEQRRLVAEFLDLPAPRSDSPAARRPRSERHGDVILLCV